MLQPVVAVVVAVVAVAVAPNTLSNAIGCSSDPVGSPAGFSFVVQDGLDDVRNLSNVGKS